MTAIPDKPGVDIAEGSTLSCSIHSWTATAAKSDSGRKLAVVGEGKCPKAGYELRLERANPGTNPDPKALVLRLVIEAPQSGAEVETPASVLYEDKISNDVSVVIIRTADGNQTVNISEA